MNRIFAAVLTLFATVAWLAAASAQPLNSGAQPVVKSGLTTTIVTIKSTAAMLVWGQCWNPNAAVAYVQAFDIAGSVTLGTSVAKLALPVAPTNSTPFVFAQGANFFNALKIAATTTSTGSSAPAVALECSFLFR